MNYNIIYLLCFNFPDHTKYKFPNGGVEAKWQSIVVKSLNAKCRGCRKRLKDKVNKENINNENL